MNGHAQTSRWTVAIFGIATILFLTFLTFLTPFLWWNRCGGDGGDPFSARASEMGQMCETAYLPEGVKILSVGVMVLVVAIVALAFSLVRRSMRALVVIVLVGTLIHSALLVPVLTLDGDCTEEQRQSLSAHECSTYN